MSILDLNDDLFPDLFVSNFNAEHSSVLFGNGDGTFVAGRSYTTGTSPNAFVFSLTAADFSGDGLPDLAVAAQRNTSIFPVLADGSFAAAIALERHSDFPATADFNRDGRPDLALVRRNDERGVVSPGVAILLGGADGAFGDGQVLRITGTEFQSGPVTAALINGDAFSDLLLVDNRAGLVKFYAGNGDGTFGAAVDTAVGGAPGQAVVGDLNGDGRLDLIVARLGDLGQLNGSLSVLLGNGDGTFQSPQEVQGQATVDGVAVGDLNGDGRLDLVAAIERPNFVFNLSVLLGRGDGTFQASVNIPPPTEFSFRQGGLEIVDLDQDGRSDVLVASSGDRELLIFRGNGDGSFQDPVGGDIGPQPQDMIVLDYNLDRKPDIALASGSLIVTLDNISITDGSSTQLFVADRGAGSTVSAGGPIARPGYATATLDFGVNPYATGVFSLDQGGVTVSEVGIPTSPPTLAARILVDKRNNVPAQASSGPEGPHPLGAGLISTDTGFAAVNLGAMTARVFYRLRSLQGQVLAEGEGTLEAGEHLSRFVGELQNVSTFVLPPNFASATGLGTLEITSDQPISVTGFAVDHQPAGRGCC